MSRRSLPLVTACSLLVFSGLVHGLWTDRWTRPEALEQALTRVNQVPLRFGDWEGKDIAPEEDEAFRRAGAQAYWIRQYSHGERKTSISVILMCGRAGRMSVHTPEVCYQGAGFDLAATPTLMPLRTGSHDSAFWTARFNKGSSNSPDLRLCWAWNVSGDWQAPSSPRWTFRGLPFLYKLYVIQDVRTPTADDEALTDFLEQALPPLRATLFPDSSR